MNISDPRLNNIFGTLIDNKRDSQGNDLSRPAFSSTKYVEPDNSDPKLPIVISCSLDCLPEIEVVSATEEDSAFNITGNNDLQIDLQGILSFGSNVQEQFILLMNHLSNPFYQYRSVFNTDDKFFLYMIFDDKLPVSWGELVAMGGFLVRDTDVPLRFPNSFESVTFALYSQNEDKFYLFFKMFLS